MLVYNALTVIARLTRMFRSKVNVEDRREKRQVDKESSGRSIAREVAG